MLLQGKQIAMRIYLHPDVREKGGDEGGKELEEEEKREKRKGERNDERVIETYDGKGERGKKEKRWKKKR